MNLPDDPPQRDRETEPQWCGSPWNLAHCGPRRGGDPGPFWPARKATPARSRAQTTHLQVLGEERPQLCLQELPVGGRGQDSEGRQGPGGADGGRRGQQEADPLSPGGSVGMRPPPRPSAGGRRGGRAGWASGLRGVHWGSAGSRQHCTREEAEGSPEQARATGICHVVGGGSSSGPLSLGSVPHRPAQATSTATRLPPLSPGQLSCIVLTNPAAGAQYGSLLKARQGRLREVQ